MTHSQFRRWMLNGVASLMFAGVAMPSLAQSGAPETSTVDAPGAFPYDLAFQKSDFRSNDAPTASPDGRHVAFVVVTPPDTRSQSVRFLPNGTPVSAVGARIHLSNANGQGRTDQPICGGRGNQWNPAWSPDGRTLAFYSDETGTPRLWLYGVTDKDCRQIGEGTIRASLFMGFQPHWSPDSRTVYVPLRPDPPLEVSDADVPNVIDVGARTEPLIFRSGDEAVSAGEPPRPPDFTGFLLANNNASLAAVAVETGETKVLVDARAEPRPSILKVSPSGRWISYAAVPSAASITAPVRDIAFFPASGGEPQVLVSSAPIDNNPDVQSYGWSGDADRLVYLKDKKVWRIDFSDTGPGEPVSLADTLGEVEGSLLYFTRDGRSVVVGLEPQGRGRARKPTALAVVPVDGGAPVRLALPDAAQWEFIDVVRADEDTLWQPDPDHLTVQTRERGTGRQALHRLALRSGESRILNAGLHRLHGFASGGDHQHLFAAYEDIDTPPDLYRFGPNLGQQTRMSMIEPRLEQVRLGGVQVIETPAPLHDGSIAKVRTTLLLPPGAEAGDRLPAVVMIYSGSDLSTRAAYYGGGEGNTVPNQIFTSRGFAVVMADVRLPEEGQASNPVQDITDVLLPQVYALANAGWIDIRRLAISGQSYGGYSTAAVVSATNVFRAGIPVNGLFDLGGRYGGMDSQGNSFPIQWSERGQGRMGEPLWDNPLRYLSNSPYYRLDRIHTPLLIVAGEGDNAVPYEQSTSLFVGLRRLERPAQLAVYPGQGHVIGDWSLEHAVDVSQRMVDFLRRHLGAP